MSSSPQLRPGTKLTDLLAEKDGVYGAIVDPVILDRMGIQLGGHFKVNGTEFEARGLLGSLPNGALRGFHLGLTALDFDRRRAGQSEHAAAAAGPADDL